MQRRSSSATQMVFRDIVLSNALGTSANEIKNNEDGSKNGRRIPRDREAEERR